MKIAYIAGPYRNKTIHGIVENIRRAEKYAIKYWKLGYAVICPHKNTALFDGLLPDNTWIDGDCELLRRSDVIVFTGNWWESEGCLREYNLARNLDKEIIYESRPEQLP